MQGIWSGLFRYDAAKVTPGIALRNTIGVALPLAAGGLLGAPATGILAATGALNVSFIDSGGPYRQRAERMVAASLVCATAVLIASLAGRSDFLAVTIALAWAFAAGMLVALDQAAADIGVISLVTLVVIFGAQALPPERALGSAALALFGGLLQTGISISLWPIRKYEPERQSLGVLFQHLASAAAAPLRMSTAPPLTQEISNVRSDLSAVVAGSRDLQARRLLSLLNQAERIRLSLVILGRYRRDTGELLVPYLEAVGKCLSVVGASLQSGRPPEDRDQRIGDLQQQAEAAERSAPGDLTRHVEALNGQLRAALGLASDAAPEGGDQFRLRESRRPWRLRLAAALPTLRANLTLESAAFRHAVRLAVCVALAEAGARTSDWSRGYWLPMTVAIILRPDFTSTFVRGLLRLGGTFAGLAASTVLFYFLPVSFWTDFALVVAFVFLLRTFGPANYGLFVIAITALVVALLAMAGIPPAETIAARGAVTLAGGVLALSAYALWPTWERTQLPESMARLLDAYRGHLNSLVRPASPGSRDRARQAARLARSNLEASLDRFANEPGCTPSQVNLWTAMLASSHRVAHALMGLEASIETGLEAEKSRPGPELVAFTNGVEITLHSLAGALRGSPLCRQELPDLRARQIAFAGTSVYPLVIGESDRLTNSVNTLAEQILDLSVPGSVPVSR